MTAVVGLHLVCYLTVTRSSAARNPALLFNTTIGLDGMIPHIPATWPLYWLAWPFVVLGGSAVLLRMPGAEFRRAVEGLIAMTLLGAMIQILFPARAPWPVDAGAMQRRFHESVLVLPYATLPSMHVAYCTVVAGLLMAVRPGWRSRLVSALVLTAVTVSTLTLKEHVLLDAVAGLALGLATIAWWKLPLHRGFRRHRSRLP